MIGRRFGSRRADGQAGGGRARSRPRLEALEPRALLATFTVTNTQDLFPDGSTVPGSLRDAIDHANTVSGADVIAFKIAGTGIHTIIPLKPLPAVTDAVKIDGTTQPGYTGRPVIEIDGSSAGVGTNGLRLVTGNITVRALAINRFSGSGIRMESTNDAVQLCVLGADPAGTQSFPNGGAGLFVTGSNNLIGGYDTKLGTLGNVVAGNTGAGININGAGAGNNVVQGNFIGIDGGGTSGVANGGDGIIISGGSFNQIGGLTAGATNIISGNANNGITIVGTTALNNNVVGNYIGVNGTPAGGVGGVPTGGTAAVPNGGAGIMIQDAARTFIGGTDPGAGNIISGNKGAGINIVNGANTSIFGNILGADRSGQNNIGNLGAGVYINNGDGTQVGGTLAGAANIIAFNGKTLQEGGVNIQAGRTIPILSNSIFNNFGLGIILQDPGGQPVANDPGDSDTGPNDLQNYPVLTEAATAAGRTLIQGTLDSAPNATYAIQFYISPTRDPSSHGEGQTLLGQTQVTTDANGTAAINITLPVPSIIGQFVSATATDSQGNTSEFALNTQVVQGQQANLTVNVTANPSPATVGADLVYTITVTNNGPDAATDVQFIQNLPAGVTFKGSSPGTVPVTATGAQVIGDLGDIASGGQAVVMITVTPTAIGQATTNVSVSSGEIDPDNSDNATSLTTSVNIPADLGLAIKADPAQVIIDRNAAIIISATNFGPGIATGVVLTMPIPAGVTFVNGFSGLGPVDFANGVVTARLGTLSPNAPVAVRITVIAPNDVPPSGALTFTASISANEIEPANPNGDPTPNTVDLTLPVLPSASLALRVTASPEPVLAGTPLTYSYVINNSGPSPGTGVFLTEAVPDGFDYVGSSNTSTGQTPTYDESTRTLTVPVGTINPTDPDVTGTITLRPQVLAGKANSRIVTNKFTLAGNEADPTLNDNVVNVVSTVSPADVGLSMTATPGQAVIGQPLTYVITVTNNGPAAATALDVNDILPTGVSFVSVTSTLGTASFNVPTNGVDAFFPSLPSGATGTITIVVTPTVSTRLVNTARVFAVDELDINTGNNSATTVTYVNPSDLSVSLVPSVGSVLAGDKVTYTATVTNAGPTVATNVTLNGSIPAGMALVSATTSQGTTATGANLLAGLGTLQPGASATVTFVAQALTTGSTTTSVTVSGDQVDQNPSNNTAAAAVSVSNAPGVIGFASSDFPVSEKGGQAVLTLVRSGGNQGMVTVHYATSDGSGLAGTNYKPAAGTVTFFDGETTKTITVPVLDDGILHGDTTALVTLSAPTGGATLGANSLATVTITEADKDLVGPTVTDVLTVGSGRTITGVTLVFDEALNPASAGSAANYTLFVPNRNGKGESPVPIQSATYDPTHNTVTIAAAHTLPLNTFVRVVVNATSGSGVQDIYGNLLRGTSASNGQNFSATFARGSSLRYYDHDGNLVNLSLSNGGLMDLYRSADGEGQILRLIGNGSRKTVLTGSVGRGAVGSDGVTTFQAIDGATFGRVDSRLTTPKFYVNEVTTFLRSKVANVSTASASAFSVSPGTVHVARHKLFARKLRKNHHPK